MTRESFVHVPVMLQEVLTALALQPGMTVIDGTVGLGGHAHHIVQAIGPTGKLFAFDRDDRNLALARRHLDAYARQTTFIHDSFANMAAYQVCADAILLDLGFSSVHVDDATRGFSFLRNGPLDMRYDTRQALTAAQVVNSFSRDELAMILRRYGEEPAAERIAKAICDARREKKFATTHDLADVVSAVVSRRGKAHPATKTFQALRIVVNDELGEVERGIHAAHAVLAPGGVLVVLTFHSLEDRLVKHRFAQTHLWERIYKKAIVPTRPEELANPRARSAVLRAARKI